jgi:hypothetical protein
MIDVLIYENDGQADGSGQHYHENGAFPMNRTLLWLIVAVVLVIGFLLYRSRSARSLDVDPHAREVIEKAKRR